MFVSNLKKRNVELPRLLFLNALYMAGVVVSFPQFFFFNPYIYGFTILGLFQTVSTAGWVLVVLAPVIYLASRSAGTRELLTAVSILIWPTSVVLIRVFLFVTTGDPGWQYLVVYPVFIVSDFLAPMFLAYLLVFSPRFRSQRSRGTAEFRSSDGNSTAT